MLPDKVLRLLVNEQKVDPDFLLYALRTRAVREHFEREATGTSNSMRNLSQPKMCSAPIHLAPRSQQRRIVEKIEALTAKSRRAKEALDAVPPLLERFRQSVLAAAFRGDLTKDWREQNPDVEPADQLLARIRRERRARWEQAELERFRAKGKVPRNDEWKKKYVEPEPVDASGLPELPAGWCWARFGEIATIAANLVEPKSYPEAPHIAPPDNIAKATGQLLAYRTVAADGVTSANHRFFAGQILYSKIRPYLNKCVIASFEGLCSADMYPIDAHIECAYLHRYMLSSDFLRRIQRSAGNRVVLPKANQDQLNDVAVPIAPPVEQAKITGEIERYFSVGSLVGGALSDAIDRLGQLDAAVLAKAFRGELYNER